jgi:hypothetical protein
MVSLALVFETMLRGRRIDRHPADGIKHGFLVSGVMVMAAATMMSTAATGLRLA